MPVSYPSYLFNIYNIRIRVSQSFNKNSLCIFFYCFFNAVRFRIHKWSFYTELRQSVSKQIIGTSVNSFRGNNVSAVCGYVFRRISYRRRSACYRESSRSAFQSSDSLLKNLLRRISKPSVYVPAILKIKPFFSIPAILEYIRRCLIYRNCSCSRIWIGIFLTYMKL